MSSVPPRQDEDDFENLDDEELGDDDEMLEREERAALAMYDLVERSKANPGFKLTRAELNYLFEL